MYGNVINHHAAPSLLPWVCNFFLIILFSPAGPLSSCYFFFSFFIFSFRLVCLLRTCFGRSMPGPGPCLVPAFSLSEWIKSERDPIIIFIVAFRNFSWSFYFFLLNSSCTYTHILSFMFLAEDFFSFNSHVRDFSRTWTPHPPLLSLHAPMGTGASELFCWSLPLGGGAAWIR